MGALGGLDDLVNRATGGNSGTPESIHFTKWDRIAGTAITFLQNRYQSLWAHDGFPGAGAAPGGTAVAPDNTTDGGLKQSDPGGGRQKWLLNVENWLSNGQGSIMVYDRLLHISGFSGTVTSAQNVGGSITRYTTTEAWNNQAWIEIYTAIGGTGTTVTMSYTDQDGNSATSPATTIGGTNFQGQGRMIPLPLASGDTGVRGVTSVTLAATTGTAGDFGVTILRPLIEIPILQIGGGGMIDYLAAIPEIKTDACLAFMFLPHTVSRLGIGGAVRMLEA